MTIIWRRPPNPDLVGLTALIITDLGTSQKQISIADRGGPCGLPEEKWLPVHASGSLKTGIYNFNGEEIEGRENAVSRMKDYVRINYPTLLLQ